LVDAFVSKKMWPKLHITLASQNAHRQRQPDSMADKQVVHRPKINASQDAQDAQDYKRREAIKHQHRQAKLAREKERQFQKELDETTSKTMQMTLLSSSQNAETTHSAAQQLDLVPCVDAPEFKDPHEGMGYRVTLAESGSLSNVKRDSRERSKTPDVYLANARRQLESSMGVKLYVE